MMKNNVQIGSVSDGFDVLKRLCEEKLADMIKTVDIADGCSETFCFWTKDIPELIGVAIVKNTNGKLEYHIDFSQATL